MKTPAHLRQWDYALTVVTVALLGTLGLQSFIGTAYVWWAESVIPGWQISGYPDFMLVMNVIAAPQVIALVIVMGLCVPKRLFDRTALVIVSAAMLGAEWRRGHGPATRRPDSRYSWPSPPSFRWRLSL